jgi:hypothetical protein
MAGIRVRRKTMNVPDDACPDRIKVDIAHKLQQVDLFLTDDRLVAVLEKLPMAPVDSIEADGIAGK